MDTWRVWKPGYRWFSQMDNLPQVPDHLVEEQNKGLDTDKRTVVTLTPWQTLLFYTIPLVVAFALLLFCVRKMRQICNHSNSSKQGQGQHKDNAQELATRAATAASNAANQDLATIAAIARSTSV